MQISQIKEVDVIDFLKLEEDNCTKSTLIAIMIAAENYILNYTGLTKEEADLHEEFYIAYMVLCQDMHDNRSLYVEKNNVNKVVESILAMHCKNLL